MTILKLFIPFILSFILINLIIKHAVRLGLTDIPNERSSHTKITPRGAGVGFGLAFFISSIAFEFSLFVEYWLIYFSIFLVFLVGILDDHKDASPKAKFYVIFLSTILLFFSDVSISTLGSYFGYELTLWYFALPFTMFALAGFTNALNLIDGLDGLAGSIALVILGTFYYIGYTHDGTLITSITLMTIVPLLAFLILNWNPAKIFMGDSGSLLLGFIVSVVAVLSLEYIHPIAVFYIAAVPIVDTLVVMNRRIRRGKSPFSPDKTHIHHILLKFLDNDVKKTVLFLVLMQVLFSLVGLMLAKISDDLGDSFGSSLALVGFGGITILFYIIFTGMKKRQMRLEKLEKNKKSRK
jgi:UDP-GlcNAc:undecaprenyl-phosphate GlcNAc-1-phosphate transferase